VISLHGVSNANILSVTLLLKEKGVTQVQVLNFEDTIKPRAKVLLIPTVTLFLKRRQSLKDMKASVIVFDTPYCLEQISDLVLLDAKRSTNFKYKFYDLCWEQLELVLKTQSKIKARKKDDNLIQVLLDQTTPSIMKPIQTYLYTIKDVEERQRCNSIILKYFFEKKISIEELRASLISVSKHNTKKLNALMTFLSEDRPKNVKYILINSKKKDANSIETLCKKFGVSSYDIRYLLASKES